MGGGGWCKVVFVSKPSPVEVGLSRVDIAHLAHINITKSEHNSKDQININSWPLASGWVV